jgi:hypothetical protein
MPFRHVVLFRFHPGTTPEQVAAMQDGLEELPALIPELADYRIGPDVAINHGNWDFVVVADFEDRDAYLTYRDHPEHQDRIRSVVAPILADRAAVQYET